jgi:hypothetical protein
MSFPRRRLALELGDGNEGEAIRFFFPQVFSVRRLDI